jgi:chromate reductase, NAD(P)H dehydrogenase (quinone)
VLGIAKNYFPYQGADLRGSFSLPSFNDNFNKEIGIINVELKSQLLEIVNAIEL